MGRSPCCNKVGLNRGAWTALEDKTLADYIQVHGEGKWRQLPKNAGLKRCGKSCRLRWLNYLRPDIKRGNISKDEEDLILRLHKLLGNRWSLIAGRIPGRTDNEIKNYWNTNLSKKAASSSSEARMTPKPQMTKANSNNAINDMAAIPNSALPTSSSRVFRTRATRCSKVVMQPPPPGPPATNITGYEDDKAFGHSSFNSNILRNDSMDNIGWSCNYNDEPAEGMMTEFTDMMDDDDLVLGDFCLSDFLNTDFYGQSIDIKENEKDIGCSGALNWALDVDQDLMKQSTNACTTGTDIERNPELFSGFIDSYDNWEI